MQNLLMLKRPVTCKACGKTAKAFLLPEGWLRVLIYNADMALMDSSYCSLNCVKLGVDDLDD